MAYRCASINIESATTVNPLGRNAHIIDTASAYETAITNSSVADSMQQISYIVESFFNNKSCLIFVIAFTVAIIITYII